MRFDFEPLLKASLAPTIREFTEMAGVDESAPYRWRKEGMSLKVAERLCDALRLHPSEVWPEWVDYHVQLAEKAEADALERTRKRQRDAQRRRYQNDPEFREREKARARAFYAETKRAKILQQERWRQANRERWNATRREWWARTRDERAAYRRDLRLRKRLQGEQEAA